MISGKSIALLSTFFAAVLSSQIAFAGMHGQARSCEDMSSTFNDEPSLTAQDSLTVPGRVLEVDGASNGGVSIIGEERSDFSVTICKSGAASVGRAALDEIRLNLSGTRLTVDGVGRRHVNASLIIRAPRDAKLIARTSNGPLSVSKFDGTLDLEAANGPVSISESTGHINANTANGPLSFRGDSGDVTLRAINGPLSVRLLGSEWNGEKLDASTKNGPLSIQVPEGYGSGVEIRSSEHSRWNCGHGCEGVQLSRNQDEKVMRFGRGGTRIQLATNNGPVRVETE